MYFVQSTFGSDNTKDVQVCLRICMYNRKIQTKPASSTYLWECMCVCWGGRRIGGWNDGEGVTHITS